MQTDTTQEMTRYVELNDWIFEIKSIRAIKVGNYGEPYSATANLCVNSDSAFVDGMMTRDQSELKEDDYETFRKLCQKFGISDVKFDKYENHTVFAQLQKDEYVEQPAQQTA